MANIGVADGVGFEKIIQDQQPYIDRIKAEIQNDRYTFDLTTTINNLQEHGTINGQIIEHKQNAGDVFFITAVMYKPDTGWWILNEPQTNDYNTRPQFWFDIRADIFRNPDRLDYGVSEQYINELSNIFVEQDKKDAIRAMCQNIGSKSMEQFAIDNTVTHGTPWHEQFEPILVIPENGNNLVIEAKYGIPYFLVGKYAIGTNALTFYHNIASRWFFMTKVERDAELTRDRQLAILAAISVVTTERNRLAAAEREATERNRLAAAAREAAERDRLARDAAEREAAERDRLAREAAEREAAERERLARDTVARDAAAAVIAVSGVEQQGEDIVEAPVEVHAEIDDHSVKNNITSAVIAASRVGQQPEEEPIVENQPEQNNITSVVIAASDSARVVAETAQLEAERLEAERTRLEAEAEAERTRLEAEAEKTRLEAEAERLEAERTRLEAETLKAAVQSIEQKTLQKKQQENAKEQSQQMTTILAAVLAQHADVRKEELHAAEIQRQVENKQQLIQDFLNNYTINFKTGEYNTIQETIKNSEGEVYRLTEQKSQYERQLNLDNIQSVATDRLRVARNNVAKIDKAQKEIEKINGNQSRVPVTDPQLIERRNELYRTIRDFKKTYAADILIVQNADDIKKIKEDNNVIQAKIQPINDKIQAQNYIIAAQRGILNEANKQIKQQIVDYLNNNKTPNIIWSKIQGVSKTDQIVIPADQDENFLKTFLQQVYDVDVQRHSKEQIAQGLYNLVKTPEQPKVDVAVVNSVKKTNRVTPRQNQTRKK